MSSKALLATLTLAVVSAVIACAGCNGSNDVTAPPTGGGGASNLVQSASTPSDGNGTMTAAATIQVNSGGNGFDEADLSQTVGSAGHEVVVTWNTSTYAINSVQSIWGNGSTTSGFTQCEPSSSACDPSKVSVDFANHTVTFTGLVLADAFGGTASATLTGTLAW
jgi:hypothetical protein